MTEKPKETPKEELECPKKYVYDTGIIFECKDNIRVEIIGEDVVDLLNELAEENQQLKQSIKEVLKLLEEEVDLFSDKATEHDINAYIELRELDNKDAYYMAVSTKKAISLLKEMIE